MARIDNDTWDLATRATPMNRLLADNGLAPMPHSSD